MLRPNMSDTTPKNQFNLLKNKNDKCSAQNAYLRMHIHIHGRGGKKIY